ncbi:hypothetical protein, partial [Alistipes putredinis]|uniref:hypothetical protein n=1 Tax=Alistipes putredinis TaxID=28117 RepID=UPI003AF183D6
VYKRRRKINPSDQDAKVAFVDDMGEKFDSSSSNGVVAVFRAGKSAFSIIIRVKGFSVFTSFDG